MGKLPRIFIDLGKYSLYETSKAQATKTKIDNRDSIQLCTAKKITNKVKRQSTEWEKNYLFYKGFITRICKKLKHLNRKKLINKK